MGSIEHSGAGDRRTRTKEMVDKWLDERQRMLVLYCKLAGIESFSPDKPEKQLLRDFCQLLIDYVAFGHFEVFDRITSGDERRGEVIKVAQAAFPKISEVTELAVAFNDKYDLSDHIQPLDTLNKDLSILGEDLAIRIEQEDKLVEALLR
ncbi:sigma D regulator [Sedimenticola sp.]|uniref:sigma D regulator n=1 Tax=Sedimenticola sp. TaxID=1940285 RepID=UPI003D0C1BDA